jgi:hypothetical protein
MSRRSGRGANETIDVEVREGLCRENEAVVIVHWTGGRHTELRVARVKCGLYPADRQPSPVEVIRKLVGYWPDREPAVTMNRMRCKSADGKTWTTVRVRELRERLGTAAFHLNSQSTDTVSIDEAASRLKICVQSVDLFIRQGVLPGDAAHALSTLEVARRRLGSEVVKIGVRAMISRRPNNFPALQGRKILTLPGLHRCSLSTASMRR